MILVFTIPSPPLVFRSAEGIHLGHVVFEVVRGTLPKEVTSVFVHLLMGTFRQQVKAHRVHGQTG